MDDKLMQPDKGIKRSSLTYSSTTILALAAGLVADAFGVGTTCLEIAAFFLFLGPPLYLIIERLLFSEAFTLIARRLYLTVKRWLGLTRK